ncbi:MAG: PCRF domain-containing protein, partial [Lentisphaeria bacterium]|nr:PCRF domain-containing protein [Lentisphaeria bacterium]
MVPGDIAGYIEKLRVRSVELEKELADPDIYSKTDVFRKVNQEHSKLSALLEKFDRWVKSLGELGENRLMLNDEQDSELRELIESDISQLETACSALEEEIQISLLPPDPNDSKNIIVEIQPAAGGDEAALFASELFRAYLYFAENQGWKVEILEQSDTDLGGIKNVSFSLSGCDVYSKM